MTPVLTFVALVPFTLLLSIGISSSPRELTFIVRQRGLLLRALLAVVVLVPAFAILLLKVFDLSPATSSGHDRGVRGRDRPNRARLCPGGIPRRDPYSLQIRRQVRRAPKQAPDAVGVHAHSH
jgi:hypothetical protein